MKKHFRATEYFTIYAATEPVEIDSDWFPEFFWHRKWNWRSPLDNGVEEGFL